MSSRFSLIRGQLSLRYGIRFDHRADAILSRNGRADGRIKSGGSNGTWIDLRAQAFIIRDRRGDGLVQGKGGKDDDEGGSKVHPGRFPLALCERRLLKPLVEQGCAHLAGNLCLYCAVPRARFTMIGLFLIMQHL